MAGALIGIRSTTLFAALLSIAVWVTPAGGEVGLKSASPAVRSAAHTTPQERTIPSGDPGFKVARAARLFKSFPRSKVISRISRGSTARKAQAARPAPAPGLAPRTPSTPKAPRIVLYNNLNSPGIGAGENASAETPPDSTGAIGPAHYVEMVNSQISVHSRSSLAGGPISTLEAFLGAPAGTPFCDPQVQWDPTAGRWFFVLLYCDLSTSQQALAFGWSKTADPTGLVNGTGWCTFAVDTSPFLLDYPKLGHNSKYLIVGANLYNMTSPSFDPPFVTAWIGWIAKPANGDITCPAGVPVQGTSLATALKNGDHATNAYTPVPVNTMSGSTGGYIVSAYDASGGNGQSFVPVRNKLAIWHLDSSGVLHQHADITVQSFAMPSPAPQLGGAFPIDTLDARLTQAVGDPTTGIWFSHTVNGPDGRSVVRWYEVQVAGSAASLTQQGDIASPTDFVFNGAISPRFDALGAAIFYNRSSALIDPVIAGQDRLSSTAPGTMEPGEVLIASSTAADHDLSCGGGFPCRWGDYSGASPDPVHTNVVWGTNEIITVNTNINTTFPAWLDHNFAVLFVPTPASVVAVAGDAAAYVSWTPAPFDPGTPISTYMVRAYVGASSVALIAMPYPMSSLVFPGLTNGVTYTFTVTANTSMGSSAESAHSNAVTPTRADLQNPPNPLPSRTPISQSSSVPSPPGR
jgi:hypothetical protein